MPEVSFFTPIYYGKNARDAKDKALEKVDSYFGIYKRKKAVILSGLSENGKEKVELQTTKFSIRTLLKTIAISASFCSVFVPIVMLILKVNLRASHKYEVIRSKHLSQSDKPASTTAEPQDEKNWHNAAAIDNTRKNSLSETQTQAKTQTHEKTKTYAKSTEELAISKKTVENQTHLPPLETSTNKTEPQSLSETVHQHKQHKTSTDKVLPIAKEDAEKWKEATQKFKNSALDFFGNATRCDVPIDFTLTTEQQNNLLEADKNKYNAKPTAGMKIVKGGCNTVIFLDKIPGFVFKPMQSKINAEAYIAATQTAQEAVIDNNYYLLHIPRAKILDINGKYFIMQEKADLLSGNFNEIKGIYASCWHDAEMKEYITTLFSQLLGFIVLTGFSDVKYNNIPLTNNGTVGLIDLDGNRNVINGLTNLKDGLFKYLPDEYLDEFTTQAKKLLKDEDHQQLILKSADIKTRAVKKAQKDANYAQFLQKNAIAYPKQHINVDHTELKTIFTDPKKYKFAIAIVTAINENLEKANNFSVQNGRTTRLAVKVCDPLTNKAKEIWGNGLPFVAYQAGMITFKTHLTDVLEGLKSAGYIYKYNMPSHNHHVKVIC